MVVAIVVIGGGAGQDSLSLGSNASGQIGQSGALADSCQTGEDANQRDDCRIVAVVNSVQDYWTDTVRGYHDADTVLFTGRVSTACGAATSAVGPFYCPADAQVYIDLGFFDEARAGDSGPRGGPFAEAYVIAHEYGHHVQNLLGTERTGRQDRDGPDVGLGAVGAPGRLLRRRVGEPRGRQGPDRGAHEGDIAEGSTRRGASVGDDRIQETSDQGRVDPESWTHGSASSANAGSRSATSRATPTPATPSPPPASSRRARAGWQKPALWRGFCEPVQ